MSSRTLPMAVGFALMFGSALAQDRAIQRGKIVKLDVEAKTITLRVGDQVRDFGLLDSTQVLDAKGKNLAEKLQGFKAGAEVNFKAAKKDGKDVLVAIRLVPEAVAAD